MKKLLSVDSGLKAELLPCPCCGGKAVPEHEQLTPEWFIRCEVCDLNSRLGDSYAEVAALWNRRVK